MYENGTSDLPCLVLSNNRTYYWSFLSYPGDSGLRKVSQMINKYYKNLFSLSVINKFKNKKNPTNINDQLNSIYLSDRDLNVLNEKTHTHTKELLTRT